MSAQTEHIKKLLEKYVSNQISETEMRELYALIEDKNLENELEELSVPLMQDTQKAENYRFEEWNIVVDEILQSRRVIPMQKRKPVVRWWWAAAILLLAVGAGIFFRMGNNSKKQPGELAGTLKKMPIMPGSEGAILTLDDGSTVVLDSVNNGMVAIQNGAKALVVNGQLVYDPTAKEDDKVYYNSLATPRGRQYTLLLPDGSRVWLNSGSSIRYPTVFTGGERVVEVTGETYFEVAKNSKIPFRVHVNGQTWVDVLGTSFNINAYRDEVVVRTTLVDGSVKVGKSRSQVKLTPGQQAISDEDSDDVTVNSDVNIRSITAWKDGVFVFDGVPLEEAMRQLERWYDIKVVYAGSVPNLQLGGSIKRSLPFSDVLRFLGNVGLKYEMQTNGKLIILP